ncbi:gamma-aminobutyric acid receptor subunit pi isoform X2 [Phyllopteryx taeniolatus]|uniref:gamma-aminobutyric acid receptor subunit pi isoform X2 n=1 Tax=Phyllopteryx taeniolatus TaxID=161469 RepID=UPI002AD44D10|nr:gamma-aminobutyric acid receptor subunit pi isoform X2 [Phyllopteryx taeniolatus]
MGVFVSAGTLFSVLLISRLLESSVVNAEVKEGEILPPTIQKLIKGYNKYLRPFFDNGPVTVGMSLDIASIDTISEINMDYTATIFLRQRWTDERLVFEGNKSLSLDGRLVELLWVPDTFIVDSKKSFLHDITVENRLIRIFPNGTVLYALRITTTVACNMDLTKYPMDKQTCTLQLESWGYNINDVMFYWTRGNESVSGLDTLQLAQYTVEDHYTSVSEAIYETGVTTVLTMTTLMMGARTSLPNANCFIKAIDVYLGICFSFIFGALIEYAVAHFCTLTYSDTHMLMYGHQMHNFDDEMNGIVTTISSHSERAKRRKEPDASHTTAPASTELAVDPSSPTDNEPKTEVSPPKPTNWCLIVLATLRKLLTFINCCHIENPHHIDNYSRVTFPLSFVLVNLLYWTYYLCF